MLSVSAETIVEVHAVRMKWHSFSFFRNSVKWQWICTKCSAAVAERIRIQDMWTKCGCSSCLFSQICGLSRLAACCLAVFNIYQMNLVNSCSGCAVMTASWTLLFIIIITALQSVSAVTVRDRCQSWQWVSTDNILQSGAIDRSPSLTNAISRLLWFLCARIIWGHRQLEHH